MGTEINNSSVNTSKGDKAVSRIKQNKNAGEKGFSQNKIGSEQVINARKAINLKLAKEKSKKKARMAKASKKKNKK